MHIKFYRCLLGYSKGPMEPVVHPHAYKCAPVSEYQLTCTALMGLLQRADAADWVWIIYRIYYR